MKRSLALHAYPTLLRVGLSQALAYRAELVVWVLTSTLPLIMLALWLAVAREAPVGALARPDFIAYYLCTLIVRQLTGSWVVWELNMEVRQGLLAVRMLRPVHPLVTFSAESLAAVPLRAVIALPVLCLLVWGSGATRIIHDGVLWALLGPAWVGAWLLQFLFMALIGTCAFFTESALGVFQIMYVLFVLLSGYSIPLELYPHWAERLGRALPFWYMQGMLVEVLLGRLSRSQAVGAVVAQWAYVVGLLALCRAAWRAGMRRYQAYGG